MWIFQKQADPFLHYLPVLSAGKRGYVLVLFDSNLIGCQGTTVIMYIV